MSQDRREKLATEIAEIRQHAEYCSEMCCDGKIADFILTREAELLKRIEEPLERALDALDVHLGDTDPQFPPDATDEDVLIEAPDFFAAQKISETLSIISEMKGEEK